MSKKTEDRQWVAESGSIYVAEYDTMRSEFPGQKNSIPVRVAVAFNVGETLANHIVKVHNDFLTFKLHDFGMRGIDTGKSAVLLGAAREMGWEVIDVSGSLSADDLKGLPGLSGDTK